MHGQVSSVYFGLSPMWVATCILVVTYAVIISEKINRAVVALLGASAMVLVGVMNQEEALKGVETTGSAAADEKPKLRTRRLSGY